MTFNTPRFALTAALALVGFSAPATHAAMVTYDIAGSTSVGGSAHPFTGSFTYNNSATGSTVYFAGGQQEGFRTTYAGAVSDLSITLNNGETVSAHAGSIDISNITQAESGAQVPQGLSLQAWTTGASGTINGLAIHNIYLAFLPMQVGMNWDGLDGYFGGNAETMLKANPSLLPSGIDPALTGTALPANVLDVFSNGLFLGTNHGVTNTVNTISTMSLHVAAVPEPETYALMLAGLGLVGFAARRRAGSLRRLMKKPGESRLFHFRHLVPVGGPLAGRITLGRRFRPASGPPTGSKRRSTPHRPTRHLLPLP